jgi:CelD/BcsL family acetyltransferase involved in cellulose biosynthesis
MPDPILRLATAAPAAGGSGRVEPVALKINRKSRSFGDTLMQWSHLGRLGPPLLAPELALLTARLVKEAEPLLVGATHRGTLVAALALARRGRTLRALRSDHTPRVDAIGDRAAAPALWRAIRTIDGWDTLELRGVPADSFLAQELPALARAESCRVYVREVSRAPWFEVRGIEGRIHRRFRGDMRRLERELGGVELERIAVFDRAALQELLRLEASSWKGQAPAAIACEERLVAFYAAAARVFARRGQLTLAFLRARGLRIAGCFALEGAETFHLLKVAHDPEYARFGPGQLLVRETALDAERRGLARYELLGQDAAHKTRWTDHVRSHVEIRVYAPSLRGRARCWAREVANPLAGRAGRTLRRAALLCGLAAGAALASGCGPPESPRPPESTEEVTPRPASAAVPASAGVLLADASDSESVETGAQPDAREAAVDADDAGPSGPTVCGLTACAPGAPCPDLIVDENDLRASIVIDTRTFAPTDCAVVEGCIAQTGTRRLLRFDTATVNIGTGDLIVGPPKAGVCFQFSQCHQHYHFLGFAQYTLYRADGTTVAATGRKQSFCLEDVEQYPAAPAPDPTPPFTCNNQGLHVGWEDVYPNDIDCQWIDVTGVPPGDYLLAVAINSAGYLPESDYANDTATVPVTIPPE